MTEPTDAEIDALWRELFQQHQHSRRSFARAVLAKWGTPPAVAGEPIAWESTTLGYTKFLTQSGYERFSPAMRAWYKPYKCSNCTTPQPAQAQAGAVPLIQQMLNALQTCQTDMPGTRFKRAAYDEHAVSAAITAAIAHIENHDAS